MKKIHFLGITVALFCLGSCSNNSDDFKYASSTIRELSDEEYPDNCDIESRSDLWNKFNHSLRGDPPYIDNDESPLKNLDNMNHFDDSDDDNSDTRKSQTIWL